MKKLIFDAIGRHCCGVAEGAAEFSGSGIAIDASTLAADLDTSNLEALYLSDDGFTVICDANAVLARARAVRMARVKAEAGVLIAATDWRLSRARERDTAGWGTLAEVDAVLAERESIRQSSGAAEAVIGSLASASDVRMLTWSVSVIVPAPRRLTQTAFLKRFTGEEAAAVLAATDSNVALRLFWQKMLMADWINPDDPDTRAGVNALEIGGLLGHGRGEEVLA